MADENKRPDGQEEDQGDSQAPKQNTGQEDQDDGDQDPGEQGGAQARIRHLAEMKNKATKEAEHWKNIATRFAQMDDQTTKPQPPTQNNYNTNEVETAYRTLAERGMATTEDLRRMELRLKWDRTHDQNERRFNTDDSRYPEYNREEVEEYARNHNIGDPLAAYQNMYFDEILDAVKSNRTVSVNNGGEKPTKPANSQKEPLTLDSFKQKLATDKDYYEKLSQDPAKFDALVRELSQTD